MATGTRIGIGEHASIAWTDSDSTAIFEYRPLRGQPLRNVAAAAAGAVQQPEDFPPLSHSVVAGDQVTLAADSNVPRLDAVLEGLLAALPSDQLGGVVIALSEEADDETIQAIRRRIGERATIQRHDPDDQDQLGYLAATAGADPIYLNRHLLDADLVIPVVVARPAGSLDPAVQRGGLFPTFADRRSQRRLRASLVSQTVEGQREAEEAAWLLGVQLLVTVVPTAEGDVASVVAGSASGVRRSVAPLVESSWRRDLDGASDLVVACLDGDHQQQTWENLGRAAHVARHLVRPGGTIIFTSQLDRPPGASMTRLRSDDPFETTTRLLARDLHRDALTASVLLSAQQDGRLLLLSRLPAEAVEELGIGAIENVEQLRRLILGFPSCLLIRAAQFCGIGEGEGEGKQG